MVAGVPDFIDGVDDFAKLRWENASASRQALVDKAESERLSRDAEREPWKSDGAKSVLALKQRLGGVEGILGPHLHKKMCCLELLDWVQKFESSNERCISYHMNKPYAVRLIFYIKPAFYLQGSKTNLIRWKWVVMKELRRYLDQKMNKCGSAATSKLTETRALRKMEYGQRSLVPLDKSELELLYANRSELNGHFEKLLVVEKVLDELGRIPICESLLHETASGCPSCGCILLGGSRNPVQYVRVVNRESGVSTMEKLDQELGVLDVERTIHLDNIDECKHSIADLEKHMFKLSRDSIQAWWTAILARRRSLKQDRIRRQALYSFHIRRLCRLKKEIDNTRDSDINYDNLNYRYNELLPQLGEYMAKVAADRADIAHKIGKIFVQKLRKSVARTRRRAYMEEEMKLQERAAVKEALEKKKNAAALLSMRKLVKTIEKRHFLCIREQCEGRTFLSKERYNAHMSIHKTEDVIRLKKIHNDKLQQAIKEHESDLVEDRIGEMRNSVLEFIARDERETKKAEKRNLMVDPQYVDLADTSFLKTSEWASQPHERLLNLGTNALLYHLDLISKRGDVEAPSIVPLDKPVVRFGLNPLLECPFICTGQAKKEGFLSKTHFVINCSTSSDCDQPITVTDNFSNFGTYGKSESCFSMLVVSC